MTASPRYTVRSAIQPRFTSRAQFGWVDDKVWQVVTSAGTVIATYDRKKDAVAHAAR